MPLENLTEGEKGKMTVTKINKQVESIEPSHYQFINPDQIMQN